MIIKCNKEDKNHLHFIYSDQQLAGIDPKLKINMDPQAHRDLRPEMMVIREELRQAKQQTLAVSGLNLNLDLA